MPFVIPHIEYNEEGWGPSTVPEKFKDVPYYTPFNKGDKLGRAADWSQQYPGKGRQFQSREGGLTSSIFNWSIQDDETNFQLVESSKAQTKRSFTGRYRFQNRGFQKQHSQTRFQSQGPQQFRGKGGQTFQQRGPQKGGRGGWSNYSKGRWGTQDNIPRKRELSVSPKESWTLVQTVEFSTLNKQQTEEPTPEDLVSCGSLESYHTDFDRLTTKSEKPLVRTERTFFNVTTSDDPIIRQLSKDGRGTIFATDVILSHLMACTRSIYPWDLLVTKSGNKIFLDKRDGSLFDFLTVNENSPDPPVEDKESEKDLNSALSLSREATFINQNFSQQVLLKGETFNFPSPNPFQSEGEEVAAVGYKYRRWELDSDLILVSRCEIDAVSSPKGTSFFTIKALNEFDPKSGVDWRKKIDTQRGAVLATELKNNSNKLAKWVAQALLSGSDQIKLGYVTRANARDAFNHVILAVQDFKTREFATQINLNTKNMWGILKYLTNLFSSQADGKYLLIRDADKGSLHLYNIPAEDAQAFPGGEDKGKEE